MYVKCARWRRGTVYNTETGVRRRAGRLLGVCASQISADFSPGRLGGGTVRQCCLREPQRTQRLQSLAFAPKLGLPALGRFPQFSAFDEVGETCMNIEAENSRNRPNMAFSPVTASRGRAPAIICNRQQNALAPLATRPKRNAETRARICLVLVGHPTD